MTQIARAAAPEENAGISEQAGFWQEQTPLGKMWGRQLTDWRATGLPKATRLFRRLHINSSARSAMPMLRMQW